MMIAGPAGNTGTANAHAYAHLVAARLLPDVLAYRVGAPAAFGFAGSDARSLAAHAPEVMYSLTTDSGLTTGLTSAAAAGARRGEFPYVVATST